MKDVDDFLQRQLEALNVAWAPRANDRQRVWRSLERRLPTERRFPSPGPVLPAPWAAQSPLAEPNTVAQGGAINGTALASQAPSAASTSITTAIAKLGSGKLVAAALVSGGVAAGGAQYLGVEDTSAGPVAATSSSGVRPLLRHDERRSGSPPPSEESSSTAVNEPTNAHGLARPSKAGTAPARLSKGEGLSPGSASVPVREGIPPSLSPSLAMLRRAQRAIRGGDPQRALALTAGARQKDATAAVEEERLALRAIAFCLTGDATAGQRTASVLASRYPGSIYATRTEQACTSQGRREGSQRKMEKRVAGHSRGKEDDDE